MTIEIKLLQNHPEAIPALAKIWYEVLGATWIPEASIAKAQVEYANHTNENCLPLTFVAFDNNKPIAMCSLRNNDGIREDLSPWLGSLVVDKNYQRLGIGKKLMRVAIQKARDLNLEKLHLFILNHDLIHYYANLGWKKVSMESFKGHSVIMMEMGIKKTESFTI